MANQSNLGLKLHVLAMYKDCQHNHGAASQAYVLDGCGQFEPSGPNGMVCAACNCHRNYHRRVEVDLPMLPGHQNDDVEVLAPHQPTYGTTSLPLQARVQVHAPVGPMQDLNQPRVNRPNGLVPTYVRPQQATEAGPSEHKKRMRDEKNEKLRAIAEKNNWKTFNEYSRDEVAAICSEVGIEKEMFKTWISCHKNVGQAAKQ